jgi:hypothetical protein
MNKEESTAKLEQLFNKARLGAIDATQFYRALIELGGLTPLQRIKYTGDAFGLRIDDAKRLGYEIENLSDEWVVEMIAALDELYGSQSDGETEDDIDQGPRSP